MEAMHVKVFFARAELPRCCSEAIVQHVGLHYNFSILFKKRGRSQEQKPQDMSPGQQGLMRDIYIDPFEGHVTDGAAKSIS